MKRSVLWDKKKGRGEREIDAEKSEGTLKKGRPSGPVLFLIFCPYTSGKYKLAQKRSSARDVLVLIRLTN